MSLYNLQKFLYELNREETAQEKYRADLDGLLGEFDLTEEESSALRDGDIGLLYVLGVNGQILMHYLMREGIAKHGPVRAGVYAMTGGGDSFTVEGKKR
jgi:hypothetical protein